MCLSLFNSFFSFISETTVIQSTETIFDYFYETYRLKDGSYINCEILDTGGQEKFDSINRQYYQRADCCILVYDITNLESFNHCKTFYKQEIINNCKEDINVILVGNKTDLEKERKISKEEGAKFAKENGYSFKETSCEKNFNVASAFETIIIMTNNDMKRHNKQNLKEKMNIEKFKLSDAHLNVENYSQTAKNKKKCC